MADIQLIDFSKDAAERVRARVSAIGLTVSYGYSRWLGGTDDLTPDPDARLIAFAVNLVPNTAKGLHALDGPRFTERRADSLVVVFLGDGSAEQLENLTGIHLPSVHRVGDVKPSTVATVSTSPLTLPLSRRADSVSGQVVYPSNRDEPILARYSGGGGAGLPVAFGSGPEVAAQATGWLIYPWFGETNGDALADLALDVLPQLDPDVWGGNAVSWVDRPPLWIGKYADARHALRAREDQWNQQRDQLVAEVEAARGEVQDIYLPLVTQDGESLKSAVARALRVFEIEVEDADQKEHAEGPQEDLWLWENGIGDPSKDPFVLAEVKGSTRSFREDDVGAITKYRLRRISELQNSRIRGFFVGNAYRNRAPADRPEPFTAQMVRDAERQGDLLITGWDIFRLVQAVIGKSAGPDAVRKELFEQGGRFTISGLDADTATARSIPEVTIATAARKT